MKSIKKAILLCIAVGVAVIFAAGCGMLADNTEYAVVSEGVLSSDGRFYYDLYENGAVTVTGRAETDQHMSIPAKLDGHPVTAIGAQAFQGDTTLKCVTLEGNVKTIQNGAFNGCSYLTRIDLGGTVRSIGDSAFYGCQVLCQVLGTEKLERIEDFSFVQCASLSFIDIPESVTYIGEQAFFGCTSIASLKLPEGKCVVGDSAFAYCESLCRAELGGIGAIPAGMFENCPSLVAIDIGKNITSIGEQAFRSCTALTDVSISKNVTYIGGSAFDDTPWLTSETNEFLVVGDGILLRYNGTDANVTIPDSVKLIADAFCGNTTVRSVTVGGKTEQIGDYAFIGCTQLNKVTVTGKVRRIGSNAFASCSALTALYLTDSIEIIDAYAFSNCVSLVSVDYGGTAGDWKKIQLDKGNEYLSVADVAYSAKAD